MLLNEIVENMKGKRNGTLNPDVKLWIYSAHDTNVVGLLNSLNIYNKKLAPYTAAVFLELRKSEYLNDTYVVTVSQCYIFNYVSDLIFINYNSKGIIQK